MVTPRVRWRSFKDGTRHIEVRCDRCGEFLRWAEQIPHWVALADEAEKTQPKPPKQGLLFGGAA
jgi:hypothetical protein